MSTGQLTVDILFYIIKTRKTTAGISIIPMAIFPAVRILHLWYHKSLFSRGSFFKMIG